MATHTTFTNAAYTAILRTLLTGSLFVARTSDCRIGVVLGIGRKGIYGQTRSTITVNPATGRRVHTIAGVMLTRAGLKAIRADILARGEQLPAALVDALTPAAPALTTAALTPTGRPGYQAVTRRADPFALIGATHDDIPF